MRVRRRQVRRFRAPMFTLGAAATAMVLMATPAAAVDVDTTTTVSVQGTVATTCPVTLTATVIPANAAGTVEFKDGATVIAPAAVVTNGTATANHTFSAPGAHVVGAKFTGAAGFKASEGSTTVTVSTGLNLGSICLPMG
ncbi:Ig-like domain-containing protein [Rhodococcus sp. NPDC056960]|uniref:Ig-like domain-containing protein n=1 Tax=Rhodococcus sp. NPDC056960 TaxID=3345982 RepID=UPI003644B233